MRRLFLALVATLLPLGLGAAATAQTACTSFPAGVAEHACTCTGNEGGAVWGSGPYTADSSLCVAARHRGVISPGPAKLRAYAWPGQSSYQGSFVYGIQSSDWGSYHASFDFMPPNTGGAAACGPFPGGDGPYVCGCTGAENGTVWGSGPYTSDSDLCAAARHAGVIGKAGGRLVVLGLAGLPSYRGSLRNGVETHDWAAYDKSVTFDLN